MGQVIYGEDSHIFNGIVRVHGMLLYRDQCVFYQEGEKAAWTPAGYAGSGSLWYV